MVKHSALPLQGTGEGSIPGLGTKIPTYSAAQPKNKERLKKKSLEKVIHGATLTSSALGNAKRPDGVQAACLLLFPGKSSHGGMAIAPEGGNPPSALRFF